MPFVSILLCLILTFYLASVRHFFPTPKLAFAIAVEARADIYLLDEVLSVGDAGFQKKSLEKMLGLLSNGATGIFVSHNINDVKKYCNRVILLKNGEVAYNGPTDEEIKMFESQMGLMSEE